MGQAVKGGGRLVIADVAVDADAQQAQVQAPGRADGRIILLRGVFIRDKEIGRVQIGMTDELPQQNVPAAVARLRPHILRDGEDAGLCQAELLLGAHLAQEGINAPGAAPGGETQNGIRLLHKQGLDLPGDLPVQLCRCCNHCFHSIT